jgi:hypothetical protein
MCCSIRSNLVIDVMRKSGVPQCQVPATIPIAQWLPIHILEI